METIISIIEAKLQIPSLAEGLYNIDYHYLWEKPMYNENELFKELRGKYGDEELTRHSIIDLFNKGEYYDGFLCAMVWGGIGSNMKGKKIFNSVFSKEKEQDTRRKIKNVIDILKQDNKDSEERIINAYQSLNNKNKIVGVGESFFTKLLYFASAEISNLPLKPLIFDRNMREAYEQIISITDCQEHPVKQEEQYVDFCIKMDCISKQLYLPSADYLEALLFPSVIRNVIFK